MNVSYANFYLGNYNGGDASITQFHGEAKADADAVVGPLSEWRRVPRRHSFIDYY